MRKFNTAKSLYKPLEIEVDGKTYQCKKITHDFLEKFLSFTNDALEGDIRAPYKQANFAFGVPLKILYQLDAPEIKEINNEVLSAMANAEKIEAETGKGPNLGSPGDKS